jgi:hypothetical protein
MEAWSIMGTAMRDHRQVAMFVAGFLIAFAVVYVLVKMFG